MEQLADSLKCIICLDYPKDAVELSCCNQIGCETCLTAIKSRKCPNCQRNDMKYTPALFMRKVIANIPAVCDLCQETTSRGELEQHNQICEKNNLKCPIEGCEYEAIETDLFIHYGQKHRRFVINSVREICSKTTNCRFPSCDFKGTNEAIQLHMTKIHLADMMRLFKDRLPCQIANCEEMVLREEMEEHLLVVHDKRLSDGQNNDIIIHKNEPWRLMNGKGNPVKMADNGKFYCGRPKSVYHAYSGKKRVYRGDIPLTCETTNGNGLNCIDCMALDVLFRNLPIGIFVNSDGKVCRSQPCDNKIHYGTFDKPVNPQAVICSPYVCGKAPVYFCGIWSKCQTTTSCKSCIEIAVVTVIPDRKTNASYLDVWNRISNNK